MRLNHRLSDADHDRVTTAVTDAEQTTDGEIVTIVARASDKYHDVALHWAVLAMLFVLAMLAFRPHVADALYTRATGSWEVAPRGGLFVVALVLATFAFLAVRIVLTWGPLRFALTPGVTKTRRVHARALMLFRTGAEKRTKAKTGVLLYLSIAERRAEIVADAAIHARVDDTVWGEAMAAVIAGVRDGRAGDGLADAVGRIGRVLTEHFPRSETDMNELPDRLIEL